MRLGARVIGVLFAANRSARPFGRRGGRAAGLTGRARRRSRSTTPGCCTETQAALEELEHGERDTQVAQRRRRAGRRGARPDDADRRARRWGRRRRREVPSRARRRRDRGRRRRQVIAADGDGSLRPGELTIAEQALSTSAAAPRATASSRRRCWPAPSSSARCCFGARDGPAPDATSASWSGPRSSPRCCCSSGAAWPRPRAGCAASCSRTCSTGADRDPDGLQRAGPAARRRPAAAARRSSSPGHRRPGAGRSGRSLSSPRASTAASRRSPGARGRRPARTATAREACEGRRGRPPAGAGSAGHRRRGRTGRRAGAIVAAYREARECLAALLALGRDG